jgi:hypothetical protein
VVITRRTRKKLARLTSGGVPLYGDGSPLTFYIYPVLYRRRAFGWWHDRVIWNIRGKAAPGHVECHE